VKAVREILATLFTQDVIGHALELIKGGNGNNRHAKLADSLGQPEHGHHQHHHHSTHSHQIPKPRSNDPSAPGKCQFEISHRLGVENILVVSARNRHSPYPLISFEDAIELIDQNIKPLEIHKIAVCILLVTIDHLSQSIQVNPDLRNHILAENVYASRDVPPRATTSVDGYALRCEFTIVFLWAEIL